MEMQTTRYDISLIEAKKNAPPVYVHPVPISVGQGEPISNGVITDFYIEV